MFIKIVLKDISVTLAFLFKFKKESVNEDVCNRLDKDFPIFDAYILFAIK